MFTRMYKNIKKVRYQRGEKKKKQKRLQILLTHIHQKTAFIALSSSIKKIEGCSKKTAMYLQIKYTKKKTDNVQLIF